MNNCFQLAAFVYSDCRQVINTIILWNETICQILGFITEKIVPAPPTVKDGGIVRNA